MQQVFTNPGVVERFFTGPGEAHLAAEVRQVLTRSWSIGEDEENAEQIIEMVKANPEKYVMKWNECGSRVGTTKFFGDKIPAKLESLSMEEREKFFIMERLEPMVVKNHFVRPSTEVALNVNVTPELGIHGCVLGNILDGTVLEYFWPESQMKTKLAEEEEGGVMKGKSVFDSPYLV
ncbi:hypothetical protein niasHT_004060 [Heterodera trifolii]|uniref:Uncharacterized protein n=1 Tax=Heterodera trifolii TaxID=157864 RepID=A0ABD2MAE8_9BILA